MTTETPARVAAQDYSPQFLLTQISQLRAENKRQANQIQALTTNLLRTLRMLYLLSPQGPMRVEIARIGEELKTLKPHKKSHSA